jgi:hypothetical protein
MSKTPEYRRWKAMIKRCHRPTASDYSRYGGRGITVCDRWRNSFLAFLEDVGPLPSPKHSIDRADGSRGYEPGNCRWATPTEQARNTSRNRVITWRGEARPLSEWCELLDLPYGVIFSRIHACGWPVEEALARPVGQGRAQCGA